MTHNCRCPFSRLLAAFCAAILAVCLSASSNRADQPVTANGTIPFTANRATAPLVVSPTFAPPNNTWSFDFADPARTTHILIDAPTPDGIADMRNVDTATQVGVTIFFNNNPGSAATYQLGVNGLLTKPSPRPAHDPTWAATEAPIQIDGLVYGDVNRKVSDLVGRANTRFIIGGYVDFMVDYVSGAPGGTLTYQWSASGGTLEAETTRSDVKWDAPTTTDNVTVTVKISANGVLQSTLNATVIPTLPRVERVYFNPDGGNNNMATLLDDTTFKKITAPQFDRTDTSRSEQYDYDASNADYKDDHGNAYKDLSFCYLKNTNIVVQAWLGAADADLSTESASTPEARHDLSASTTIKLKVASPSTVGSGLTARPLSFVCTGNGSSAKSAEVDVQDWSGGHGLLNQFTFRSSSAVANTIDFAWKWPLDWTVAVKDMNGTWIDLPVFETQHRSYCVVDKMPIKPAFFYAEIHDAGETWAKVAQFSCDWNSGQSGGNAAQEQALIAWMWSGYTYSLKNNALSGPHLNITYSFSDPLPAPGLPNFLQVCHGTCGPLAQFFAACAAAQGVQVDTESFTTTTGGAMTFAVDQEDVNGSWCNSYTQPGINAAPLDSVSGNPMWWYTYVDTGTNTAAFDYGNHAFCSYNGGVDDTTFGIYSANTTWGQYVSAYVYSWGFTDGSIAPNYKRKSGFAASDTVHYYHVTNYESQHADTGTWGSGNPFP